MRHDAPDPVSPAPRSATPSASTQTSATSSAPPRGHEPRGHEPAVPADEARTPDEYTEEPGSHRRPSDGAALDVGG